MKRALVAVAILGLMVTSVGAGEPPKGLQDPPGEGVPVRATGGPDGFGYTYFDQADGCPLSWIARDGGATQIATGDDSGAPATLGGTGFDFYGVAITQVAATTNGYLSTLTTDNGPDLSNDCPLPTSPSTGGGARIYPLHDDLVTTVYHEYFAACPRGHDVLGYGPKGCNVFWWEGTYLGDGTAVFQAILYDDVYEIVFQYQTATGGGASSATGIQNDGATIGLTYVCNAVASITTSTAVCFAHPSPVPVELQSFDAE